MIFGVNDNITAREKIILNNLYDTLYYISPLLNRNLGATEPPTRLKVNGFLAFADGTNWNPAGDGTKGYFRWNSGTSAWVYVG